MTSTIALSMGQKALLRKLQRTTLNTSAWWGVTLEQASAVIDLLHGALEAQCRDGTLAWPDPALARVNPGTHDDQLKAMAAEGAAVIAALGTRPSARNVWAWCRARGARKRQAAALRIIGNVVSDLCAREVAASFVQGGHQGR